MMKQFKQFEEFNIVKSTTQAIFQIGLLIQFFLLGFRRNWEKSAGNVLIPIMGMMFFIAPFTSNAQTETFNTGSYIINMGIVPQTINNGLKPYGLIYDLIKNNGVVVKWVISPTKVKDGEDFNYNGTSFKGGTFIIPKEYRNTAVNSKITSYGVTGTTTISPLTVNVTYTLSSVPTWTLDLDNGDIAEDFFANAGIPTASFNYKLPSALAGCDDIFVMPHADPAWSTHNNLRAWNLNHRGSIWAGCNAVSHLENLNNGTLQMNFLANNVGAIGNALVPDGSHADATPPYNHNHPTSPVAQYMGSSDGAHTNGAEQVYLPKLGGGWRSTTQIISNDPTQSNVPSLSPGPAAIIAFGRGFGDPNRGWVMYEAGHNIDNDGTVAERVAAQRAFFNFSFLASIDKVPKIISTNIPTLMSSLNTYTLSVTANSPAGSSLTYLWSSSCGGTFTPTNASSTTFTAPTTANLTSCIISCKITDACGRITTVSVPVTIRPIETDPDMNATLVNVSVPGNVNTNDDVPPGTTYGTPNPVAGNPPGGVIVMNPNGTYTFISPNIGEYNYLVPVCPPGVTGSNCLLELLTITVTQPYINTEAPTANPDVATTMQNTPVTVSVLTNDACNNGPNCTLSNPTIVDAPNNGTVTVNANGTVTYTPNTNFIGLDTFYYRTCDNQQPSKCDTAEVFITVNPTGSPNVTAANDDFETGIIGVPVTGNALTNDTDPEGHAQTATTQNVTNANGTFVLNANGTFTFTPAQGFTGPVSYPYSKCDNGTPTACDTATIYILIEPILETDPDMNATLVNVSVPGNVNTNDDVPTGTTYGTPNPIAGNPPGGVINMNPNGTYTFISPNIGEYNYLVPVCAPGVTGSNCLLELLTITVTAPYINTEPPTANPDIATTLQNTPVTVSVLTNDACNNGAGCTLSNPNIVDPPNNGTVTVNPNGTVTYTPNTGFVGIDTLYYSTCDNQQPPQCDTAGVFITVIPTGSANVTAANDDFETGIIGVPVTGNALTNDTDPEGHVQTATTQNVTNANGTFVLNANGTFTFTPAQGFTGPVSYPYTVCDNGTPTACDTATIYILIEPILETDPDMNATLVNVSVPGNVNTNDDVPAGTTYGTPNPIAGNPPGGVIVMNPNGTYTFISPNIGEYNYLVPVCAPGVTGSNCLLELLTITVTAPYINTEPPTANPDIATTLQNTPVTVSVLTNDACNNGAGCTLSNPNIVDPPNNGTVTVNPNGTVTYTPNNGFVGIDTLYYSTCDNQQPPQCDTAGVFITVIPTGSANVTAANDDFETGIIGVPVTGNALTNDTDPEGHVQTATTQNVTNANGTFVLNANGTFTFTPAQGFTGPVSYPYTVCDNGTPTACDTATIYILIEPILETDPDMNATLVNVSVPGNVNTNDDVPAGTTYGTPNPIAGNPPGGVIVMNPNGTYTFISPNIGEYNYLVPVCAPGVTGSNCLLELLTITVTAPYINTEPPTANPDIATTLQNTPVTVSVLTNDACNNGAGCTLSNPNIVDPPNNGTVTVNANGTVTYTPNTGFVGIDTLYYSTCDNQQPPQCDTAGVFITVIPTGSANVTAANDDFETGIIGVPVTGNALTNDTDPEGHVQTATTQNVTNANGTFVLNANGTFTFTPAQGFTGPVSYPYTVCDNGTPTACDTATIYILIEPIIETDPDMNATLVNVSVPGNVNTNDDVPAGTTYGTPNPIAGNPPGGVIVMNPNGTYTFISPNIGEYNYLVPVCAPGVTGSNCLLELLTITVTEPYVYTEPPTANPDIATTLQNTPVTVSVLTNDACNNGAGCTLSNPNIVDPPNNGTVTVNPNGTVTYTPNTGFVGIDTLYYSTCDNQQPPQCDTAGVFITVIPTGSANVTAANDDFETGIIGVPVTGNALTNDTDPEGHVQTATTQNVTNANGTFVLNANGTFTFTPAPGFTGPVSYPYSVCDNGIPTACDTATIYILIEPILEIAGNVLQDNDGPTNINGTGTGTAGGTQLYANLASSAGLVIAIVPVNPNGSFVFTNVTSNTNYSVVITTTVGTVGSPVPVTTLPSGWTHVGEDCCDNIGNDGTPNGITTVVMGTTTVNNVNFGITQLVSVGNQVWNDANRNGIKDASEVGLVGATVNVYADANSDGTPDGAALQTTTTGTDGLYIFDGLVSGNYVIGVIPPGGPSAFTSSIVGQELNPNNNIDNNDNGIITIGNETRTGTIVLSAGTEPTGELPNNTTAVDANANLTVDFGFFACPGTFTFAPQYVCTGNIVNLTTLEPAGFTGGVWSQGGTTLSSTNVGVGSYTYTFQEGACVSSGTVVVELNTPDYTPTLAIAPSAITGISNVRVIATIAELLNRPSCSDIYVFVPRLEPRFTFTYEPTATIIGGVSVNNSAWQFFNTNPNFYVWKYVGGATFPAAGSVKFGYLGSYDPNQTDGVTTFSVQVFQGSGGETNLSNNTDSEVLLYFR